jgi:hypothetical protein
MLNVDHKFSKNQINKIEDNMRLINQKFKFKAKAYITQPEAILKNVIYEIKSNRLEFKFILYIPYFNKCLEASSLEDLELCY